MRNRKYFLDLNDLQYKQVRLPWKKKLLNMFFWLSGTIGVTMIYASVIGGIFGSPKEKMLSQEVDNLKLQYTITGKQIDHNFKVLENLKMSDEVRYRPILEMDSIPWSIRNPGFGGVERFREMDGYFNSGLMKSTRMRVEEMRNMITVQEESFKSIEEKEAEWERMLEYVPWICPVRVDIRKGDGLKFREVHPVLGTPQWHHGQDFTAPYGTEVYATGAGRVIEAGWNSGGYGNYVIIDHGYYGYQSLYAHLSSISVSKGLNVKRGDKIGLSGNTGTSSGPHLHYEINQYGQHKNPLSFFNDDLTVAEYFEMIQKLSSGSLF